MSALVAALADHPFTLIFLKAILTCFFWMAGLFGVFNFRVVVAEMVHVRLPAPAVFALATIATQLVGSALLISDFGGLGWVGAGALAVFTLLTIPTGHAFWKFAEPQRTAEFHVALEHITVIGGLLIAGLLSLQK